MAPTWHNKVTITLSAPIGRRQHKKTFWMSEAYHRRVQKKWDKQFIVEVRFVEPPRVPGKVYPRMFGEDIFTVRQHG